MRKYGKEHRTAIIDTRGNRKVNEKTKERKKRRKYTGKGEIEDNRE